MNKLELTNKLNDMDFLCITSNTWKIYNTGYYLYILERNYENRNISISIFMHSTEVMRSGFSSKYSGVFSIKDGISHLYKTFSNTIDP